MASGFLESGHCGRCRLKVQRKQLRGEIAKDLQSLIWTIKQVASVAGEFKDSHSEEELSWNTTYAEAMYDIVSEDFLWKNMEELKAAVIELERMWEIKNE